MRSRKLAALQQTLRTPPVHGASEGDLLLVGWGSTRGAIEEAVDLARAEGLAVSSLHLRFLNPLPPGLLDVFQRFRRVVTVELNYSDDWDSPLITRENRRYGQLAWVLRASTLLDVDCVARVPWAALHARGDPRGGAASHRPRRRERRRQPAVDEGSPLIMSKFALQCVLEDRADGAHTLDDYAAEMPRWCKGCGDHGVLAALQRVLAKHDVEPENAVSVSGIGARAASPTTSTSTAFTASTAGPCPSPRECGWPAPSCRSS
jgi:hypothetical protein